MAQAEETPQSLKELPFETLLKDAYNFRGKRLVLLTGDVYGLFWNGKLERFITLEQSLYQRLSPTFNLVRTDAATGIDFLHDDMRKEVARVMSSSVRNADDELKRLASECRHDPLAQLVLLKNIDREFGAAMLAEDEKGSSKEEKTKPLCIIVRFSGSIFPKGDFSSLSELDRQRLVYFLSWMHDPRFVESKNLVILVSDTKTEVNSKISVIPSAAHIEIQLPDLVERKQFVEVYLKDHEITFEGEIESFCQNTAGMTFPNLRDLLEVAHRKRVQITKKQVVEEVNAIVKAQLGDIVTVKYPSHSSKDLIGYGAVGEILKEVFTDCDSPETAVSAILVSGPNGVGKTYQVEAFAHDAGRVVIELSGIRGSLFGDTDKFFELLRWRLFTLGKVLIEVDEAHTAMPSVHQKDTHETERRLGGNILKMMGDESYLGKVLWVLMSSRPDELDPDIKSRAPIQIPMFDLEGEEREQYVSSVFAREGVNLDGEILKEVMKATSHFSARDYRDLRNRFRSKRKKKANITLLEVLAKWRAGTSIILQREVQSLIAAQNCSYPDLVPLKFNLSPEDLEARIFLLKQKLHW